MGAKRLSTLQSALADRKQVQVDQVRFPRENILERLPCPPVLLRVRGALIQHLAAHRLPPEVKFLVVGSSPSDRVRALGDEPGVTVTGFVEDPRDYLERADVVVTPMRHGAVMQNKVLEAMTLARPVVTTSLAREGIDAVDDEHLVVADGAGAFADETTELLDSRADRRRLGANARDLVTSKYTWSQVGQNLREAVTGVLEQPM